MNDIIRNLLKQHGIDAIFKLSSECVPSAFAYIKDKKWYFCDSQLQIYSRKSLGFPEGHLLMKQDDDKLSAIKSSCAPPLIMLAPDNTEVGRIENNGCIYVSPQCIFLGDTQLDETIECPSVISSYDIESIEKQLWDNNIDEELLWGRKPKLKESEECDSSNSEFQQGCILKDGFFSDYKYVKSTSRFHVLMNGRRSIFVVDSEGNIRFEGKIKNVKFLWIRNWDIKVLGYNNSNYFVHSCSTNETTVLKHDLSDSHIIGYDDDCLCIVAGYDILCINGNYVKIIEHEGYCWHPDKCAYNKGLIFLRKGYDGFRTYRTSNAKDYVHDYNYYAGDIISATSPKTGLSGILKQSDWIVPPIFTCSSLIGYHGDHIISKVEYWHDYNDKRIEYDGIFYDDILVKPIGSPENIYHLIGAYFYNGSRKELLFKNKIICTQVEEYTYIKEERIELIAGLDGCYTREFEYTHEDMLLIKQTDCDTFILFHNDTKALDEHIQDYTIKWKFSCKKSEECPNNAILLKTDNGLSGIYRKGEGWILDPLFEDIILLGEWHYKVKTSNGKFGLFDCDPSKAPRLALLPNYKSINRSSYELYGTVIVVDDNNKYGLYSRRPLRWILEPQYDDIQHLSNEVVLVDSNKIINTKGEITYESNKLNVLNRFTGTNDWGVRENLYFILEDQDKLRILFNRYGKPEGVLKYKEDTKTYFTESEEYEYIPESKGLKHHEIEKKIFDIDDYYDEQNSIISSLDMDDYDNFKSECYEIQDEIDNYLEVYNSYFPYINIEDYNRFIAECYKV